ncbi:MAG: diaminopimelate decarboxylase [Planctomycetales bacterium]|nr:diaminopimelate decarboxylase [Planctomycetales bacterium]
MPITPRFPPILSQIAGLAVADLVAEVGTPAYVYDAAKIVERIEDLAAFDVVRFAQKACSNLAILDLCRRHGALVDAVSAWEIRRALAAGYGTEGQPPPIVYTADIFDRQSLELVRDQRVHVNCGSPDMIDQLGQCCGEGEISLRINPGFGHGHSQKTNTGGAQSKHGIWHEQLGDCLGRAASYGLKVTGLHMHIGSGTDLQHLSQVCAAMEEAAQQVGPPLSSISAGGGLPVPYQEGEAYVDLDAYFQLWNATRQRLEERLGHPLTLEIEPGRYLTAEAGYLISEIRAIKRMGGNLFYLVDAGFNDLARPILYGAYHPMALAPADGATERAPQEVVVGGPLCESGDIFTQAEGGFVRSRSLPEAEVGDYLVIGVAGAYGAVMASNYNSKPLAPELLIVNGQTQLIRRRQTFAELVAGERIPPAE